MTEKPRYIAIEGPIGVGKSSLAELLAKELAGHTLIEEALANPFLPSFYVDMKKYAFQTQLFFLLSRYQQQKDMLQQELFNATVVSDYLFAKDKIFAYLNLDENELGLYEQVYRLLDTRIPKPDLVIYLQASTQVLLERIGLRNMDYEKQIKEEYLEKLVDSYNRYFFYYNETPLLVVNTTDIDFVNNKDDLSGLVREIRTLRGGAQHYLPIASRAR
ncbi:MAG: deoxynucleoside kinase [Deltaproteobacteria bacterium]|nr:deoxynucleoside kinase [Deltaproteobacteria bacterium]